jgi:hypothetical protein
MIAVADAGRIPKEFVGARQVLTSSSRRGLAER